MRFRHLGFLSSVFIAVVAAAADSDHAASPPHGLTWSPDLRIHNFKMDVPQQQIDEMKQLVKLGRLPPKTYESTNRTLGIEREWMEKAKKVWEEKFDWRKWEKKVNKVMPQYTAEVKNKQGDETFKIHFVGIWSEKKDAVPLILLHGWPGAFTEFLPLVEELKKSTNPAYHIVIPSLPGYAFSSRPPVHRDFTMWEVAGLMDNLMEGLGFGDGYIAQGGDIGSWLAMMMSHYDGCKGIHLNMFAPGKLSSNAPPPHDFSELTAEEGAALQRMAKFGSMGNAYTRMHSTRPSTVGHITASNPLALLAWVGEKYLDWMEEDPSIDTVLELVTLYWMTETMPTSIYPYRQLFNAGDHGDLEEQMKIMKPFGMSWFPYDVAPFPKAWAEKYGDLVYFKHHTKAGHWPMQEAPKEFAQDIAEFSLKIGKLKSDAGNARDEL